MYLERAKSGRSKCVSCGIDIHKNEMRLAVVNYGFGQSTLRFRCVNCAKNIVRDELDDLLSIERRLIEYIKQEKRKQGD